MISHDKASFLFSPTHIWILMKSGMSEETISWARGKPTTWGIHELLCIPSLAEETKSALSPSMPRVSPVPVTLLQVEGSWRGVEMGPQALRSKLASMGRAGNPSLSPGRVIYQLQSHYKLIPQVCLALAYLPTKWRRTLFTRGTGRALLAPAYWESFRGWWGGGRKTSCSRGRNEPVTCLWLSLPSEDVPFWSSLPPPHFMSPGHKGWEGKCHLHHDSHLGKRADISTCNPQHLKCTLPSKHLLLPHWGAGTLRYFI